MSNLRDAAIIIGVSLAATAWFQNRPAPEATQAEVTTPVVAPTSRTPRQTASTLTLYKQRGQFYADGYANGGTIPFLVDTGASVVALRLEDARAAGIDTYALDYSAIVSTANGRTRAAPVTLKTLTIGPITQSDVRALVLEDGLEISLLGMTFLEKLQKFEATGDSLTLTL